MAIKHPVIFASLLLLCLWGCKKKDAPAGPQGATGPEGAAGIAGYHGIIAGHISLYDKNGAKIFHGLDSVTVSLNDTIAMQTDSNGYYMFTNVPTGNYNIKVSDPGYGRTQSGNFAFIKDTLYKELRMSQKPDFDVTALTMRRMAGFPDMPSITTLMPAALHAYILFVSKSPQVSSSNYLLYYTFIPYTGMRQIQVSTADYNSAGIFYGDTVYYAAYSYIAKDYSAYADDKAGTTVFTAVGSTSALDTMVAP